MVIKAEPVLKAVQACRVKLPGARVIFLGPQGSRLDHQKVMELSSLPAMILLCGHYEGIDQRALDAAVDEEISIGDYVLSGGEYAAAVLIDCVVRQLPGALGDENSAINDSFFGGILDYPHFTRPAELAEGKVPEVLLSGNHQEIQRWRREQALAVTLKKRPDLLDEATLDEADRAYLQAKRGQ
jgi:tRNA (guanine37-N1)-methyltransferase